MHERDTSLTLADNKGRAMRRLNPEREAPDWVDVRSRVMTVGCRICVVDIRHRSTIILSQPWMPMAWMVWIS